jgi:hypothetical protein
MASSKNIKQEGCPKDIALKINFLPLFLAVVYLLTATVSIGIPMAVPNGYSKNRVI